MDGLLKRDVCHSVIKLAATLSLHMFSHAHHAIVVPCTVQSATSAADVPVEPPPLAATAAAAAAAGSSSSSASSGSSSSTATAAAAAADAATQAGEAALAEVMLRRLQRLPWRRIDVSFGGAKWGLAHNNIQVGIVWVGGWVGGGRRVVNTSPNLTKTTKTSGAQAEALDASDNTYGGVWGLRGWVTGRCAAAAACRCAPCRGLLALQPWRSSLGAPALALQPWRSSLCAPALVLQP